MPSAYFPLRWESTGDQWWYASPIDWAAANGHYDLVSELLHLDNNLLIKLTSLRRIRRLETVWDDEFQFKDVAQCRSHIARRLLIECQDKKGQNSLIRAGYGGWLLYTAASAGDMAFVKELLEKNPLLIFGEGEYGVTDILYAAARSKNSDVFKLLLDSAVSSRCSGCTGGELDEQTKEGPEFRWEMMNRAIHAAARGGSVATLKELLGDCGDVLVYRDAQGSTILHSASGRGQVEVVNHILAYCDIITSKDNQGNTALNVASYRGCLAAVKLLIEASPSSAFLANNYGDTFLHMAVAGFRTPGFRRLDRQIDLVKELISEKLVNVEEIINVKNNDGRTALHMAVIDNLHTDLVELLMSVRSADLNVRDVNGMTPLDILRQRSRSPFSEILIKRLISAGGISNCQDHMTRNTFALHLKMQSLGGSPGTSFRIPDAEIVLHSGLEQMSEASCNSASIGYGTCSGELTKFDSDSRPNSSFDGKKLGSISNAATQLKLLFKWKRRKERRAKKEKLREQESVESYRTGWRSENSPIPLRQRFSKFSSMPNNKRILPVGNNLPSPSSKKKFVAGLMHGVIQVTPSRSRMGSPSSPFSESSWSSYKSIKDDDKGVDFGNRHATPSRFGPDGDKYSQSQMNHKEKSLNRKLMNKYFCFGAQGLALGDAMSCTKPRNSSRHEQL